MNLFNDLSSCINPKLKEVITATSHKYLKEEENKMKTLTFDNMINELDYYDSCSDDKEKETIDLNKWRSFINQQQYSIIALRSEENKMKKVEELAKEIREELKSYGMSHSSLHLILDKHAPIEKKVTVKMPSSAYDTLKGKCDKDVHKEIKFDRWEIVK